MPKSFLTSVLTLYLLFTKKLVWKIRICRELVLGVRNEKLIYSLK